MNITKVQLRDLIAIQLQQKNGVYVVLGITLSAMMKYKRTFELEEADDNKVIGTGLAV